ncbi:RNA polymerase sigma-70 factor [Fulvivirgaceae bacterium BMA10]|uniref:RNA polymerase sigma-70 factor n=1 Tax=Splendidivirga corallicola TaxID=3051826 RepID=A0ABT8KUB2_9BACT|nr:RNA polymerase sigma-70 factor [Fulvivirgaceae bacterium BMA10]
MQKGKQNTEKNILTSVSKGSHESFELLFNNYGDFIFHYAFRTLRSKEEADDIVQQAFVQVWKNRTKLPEIKSFKDYLFIVSKNLILARLKTIQKERSLGNDLKFRIEISHNRTEEDLIYSDFEKMAKQAIASLPPQRSVIFQLRKEEGYSYSQIAKRLSISENTVKVSLYQSMQHIRNYLSLHADLTFILIALIALS